MKEVFQILPNLVSFFGIDLKELNLYMLRMTNISKNITIPKDYVLNFNPVHQDFKYLKHKTDYPEGVMLDYPLDGLIGIDATARNADMYEKVNESLIDNIV